MKAILTRLFNHEELTTEEARQLLLNISREYIPKLKLQHYSLSFKCVALQ